MTSIRKAQEKDKRRWRGKTGGGEARERQGFKSKRRKGKTRLEEVQALLMPLIIFFHSALLICNCEVGPLFQDQKQEKDKRRCRHH